MSRPPSDDTRILDFPQKKVLFFDFDGVLVHPWSHPEIPYAHIERLLDDLATNGFTLCIASFSPAVRPLLRRFGWADRFKAIRCGSNVRWTESLNAEGEETAYMTIDNRFDLCKAKQISDMMEKELKDMHLKPEQCAFFDDLEENLAAVDLRMPNISCILVNPINGLQRAHIIQAHE